MQVAPGILDDYQVARVGQDTEDHISEVQAGRAAAEDVAVLVLNDELMGGRATEMHFRYQPTIHHLMSQLFFDVVKGWS